MTNNDVFRRLRYALSLNNQKLVEIFRHCGMKMGQSDITALMKKEGEEGYQECNDQVLVAFLDGLIASKRGVREGEPGKDQETRLTNNEILKKIRIALALKEDEMLDVFKMSQFRVSRSELSAVFRAEGQENYKPCGDQMLRNFLKGLTLKYRGGEQG